MSAPDPPLKFEQTRAQKLNLYRGIKYGKMQDTLKGIQRPTTGSAGNDDPDWKALYAAPTADHAAGYVTPRTAVVGGPVEVVRIEFRDVTVVRLNRAATGAQNVTAIRNHFRLPADRPMMDGSPN
ncbi:hypothetical protein AB0G85_35540 [Streptomyces sioyaensis]|uniref:hypothetical protein n=1 Tax=Streptomyces sioyaensis TaxID=67364 RepID=UPI0033C4DD90